MSIVQPQHTHRSDIDIPVEERLIPVHVPKHVERYARQLAEQYSDDVEQWVLECLVFKVRLLLRHDRPDGAPTHTVHTSVDAETFAAVQATGNPDNFVRQALQAHIEWTIPAAGNEQTGTIIRGS